MPEAAKPDLIIGIDFGMTCKATLTFSEENLLKSC
jgi:N-formylglutamate amidohydrolase